MVICVVLISTGKEHQTKNEIVDEQIMHARNGYLVIAVVLALITGLILTLNSLIMRYFITKMHFSALQLNNDGGLI